MSKAEEKGEQSPAAPGQLASATPVVEPLALVLARANLGVVPRSMTRTLKRAAIAAPFIAGGFALLFAGLEYLGRPPHLDDEDD